jgi:hypothetical protein
MVGGQQIVVHRWFFQFLTEGGYLCRIIVV